MENRPFLCITGRRPVKQISEFALEYSKFFLQKVLVGQFGIFPDERDHHLRGIGLVFKDVTLHGTAKEVLLCFSNLLETLDEAVALAWFYLHMNIQAAHLRTCAIDTPG